MRTNAHNTINLDNPVRVDVRVAVAFPVDIGAVVIPSGASAFRKR